MEPEEMYFELLTIAVGSGGRNGASISALFLLAK